MGGVVAPHAHNLAGFHGSKKLALLNAKTVLAGSPFSPGLAGDFANGVRVNHPVARRSGFWRYKSTESHSNVTRPFLKWYSFFDPQGDGIISAAICSLGELSFPTRSTAVTVYQ